MSTSKRRALFRGSSRVLATGLASLGVVAAMLAVTQPAQASPSAAPDTDKIQPKLAKQLDDKGEATFWVRFDTNADLTAASKIKDWEKRGKAVYDALRAAADTSQKDAIALLDHEDADYKTFWATNAIRVDAGSEDLAEQLTTTAEVARLYPTFDYRLEEPKPGKVLRAKQAIEWGVDNINADDVWDQYGDRGEGMIIANIDTGVELEHPALVNQYRGNNGDGTFTHDYNWFDAADTCDGAPCDNDEHGSHTMGTMIGDDGADNQIGVAPGAKWIAANGCCPSDAALIESGQWMLAPTDLQGENPDVSMRPNIINNSWGTTQPTNDPFMEDVQEAWAASGMFGSWSNGNSGSACETSGSPGSRIINYSVGAYDVNNGIASFSSRGAGQDGEIKPNISAPGVNVRSSVPGGGYASFNGTSMAAPHLAGTVALLWSAAPALTGDIEGTRALLDGSAVDAADDQCGGTEADNNVFGEGRLDALALLESAPVGDTGTAAGTVTDESTGDALANASVDLEGEVSRSLSTDADGAFSVRLPVGDYTATVSKFGYGTATVEVTVAADETATVDVALTPAESSTVTGTVTDNGGHGWPLYAKVSVDGADPVYTDPETGTYSIELPVGASYELETQAQLPGYRTSVQEVTVEDGETTADVAVDVDASTCAAMGYAFNTAGTTESFDGAEPPEGWSVVDHADSGQAWSFDDPGGNGNLTGGEDGFAVQDSDAWGSGGTQDTSLVSPVVDMTDVDAPVVGFKQDHRRLSDTADVDVSIDGGETWETVLSQSESMRGPREDVVQLPTAANQSEVQVRFHHVASYDWWWQVDDVFIGNRTCDPVEGGLVVGNVTSTNTGEAVNGAVVTSVEAPEEKATTAGTPDDENLDDGFYWLFSSLTGSHEFEATFKGYSPVTSTVDVAADDTTRQDYELSAGSVVIDTSELSFTKRMGGAVGTKKFTVTNDGEVPVNLELSERGGGFEMLGADGSRTSKKDLLAKKGAPLQKLTVDTSIAKEATKAMGTTKAPTANGPQEDPWTDIADYQSTVMDNRVVYVDGTAYSIAGGDGTASTGTVAAYDPATLSWSEKSALPEVRNAVAAGEVNGQIVVTGGWGDDGPSPTTWTYDPAADSWTEGAEAPVSVAAAGQAVLDGKLYVVGGCTTADCTPMSNKVAAYDAASDSWEPLADYPVAVAFASCGGIDGALYCTGGNDGADGVASTYSYDPGTDTWTEVADAPSDSWASQYAVANGMLVVNGGVQAGAVTNRTFAYDAAAEEWVDLPNSNTARYRGAASCGVYKVGGSSGGFTATVDSEMLPGMEDCGSGASDVEWMEVSPTTAILAPGQSVTVQVSADPNVAQPGTYTAAVGIKSDTPVQLDPVSVTMTVNPPARWGKLAGTVTGADCDGAATPIAGATVQADSDGLAWTFETAADGTYARWFDSYYSPLQLIGAKDGFIPVTKKVQVKKGQTTDGDLALKPTGC